MVLPSLNEAWIKRFENLFSDFLWNGKKAKIPIRTLQLDYEYGGLKLTNLKLRDISLKISWINILQSDEKMSNIAYSFLNPVLGADVWRCNLEKVDVPQVLKEETNPFWFDVLHAWCTLNFNNDMEKSSDFIWFNSGIRIQGKPVFWPKYYKAGLKYVKQLYENNELISARKAHTNFSLDLFHYNMLISAIPSVMRNKARSGRYENGTPLYDELIGTRTITKVVYSKLIAKEEVIKQVAAKWQQNGFQISSDIVKKKFREVRLYTNTPKYRSFQYRLLHRSLVMNTHLYQWKILSTNLCTFCEETKETMEHLLCSCSVVLPIWEEATKTITIVYECIPNINGQCKVIWSTKCKIYSFK